ncbi:Zn-dependent hydrolase, partial [Leucobacter sp. M11]|uniref:Zn-dependent hydrolase n=1 Tax=Leucobacter sp. M11 TaxID=2993565 RepID=UPI002D7FAE24
MTAQARTGAPRVRIDGALIERLLVEMSEHGTDGGTGVARTVYSPEWVGALDTYRGWCAEAGLDSRVDAVGNVWAVLPGTEPGPSIVTGSHVDTQVPGGRYDGTLGWLAGFVALTALRDQFGPPTRTLEAVGFCEEESSRFPANFWGSRAITGAISPEEPGTLLGLDNLTIGEAMHEVGLSPDEIPSAARSDIDTFVELHIEQGPILEAADEPVGIVTGITGLRHYRVTLRGTANHAGAFPMDLRRDPMVGFAALVTELTRSTRELGRPAVTTIGRATVEPNAAAIIADRVEFVVDVRHPEPEAYAALLAMHEATMLRVAEEQGLDIEWQVIADHAPVPSDPGILAELD